MHTANRTVQKKEKIMTTLLTRDQAIAIVGAEAVDQVEAINCEMTNRLIDGGFEILEFSASLDAYDDENDVEVNLTAYYYQDDTDGRVKNCEDLSNLTWTVAGYKIA